MSATSTIITFLPPIAGDGVYYEATISAYTTYSGSGITPPSHIFDGSDYLTTGARLSGLIEFGDVYINDSSNYQTFHFRNEGDEQLTISSIVFPNGFRGCLSGDFVYVSAISSFNLEPFETIYLYVKFYPEYERSYEDVIYINSDAEESSIGVAVNGTGILYEDIYPYISCRSSDTTTDFLYHLHGEDNDTSQYNTTNNEIPIKWGYYTFIFDSDMIDSFQKAIVESIIKVAGNQIFWRDKNSIYGNPVLLSDEQDNLLVTETDEALIIII